MAAVPDTRDAGAASARLHWLPVLAGFAALYVPTFYDLAGGYWQDDEGAHGPIILAVVVWLIWQRRAALSAAPAWTAPVAGFTSLGLGLVLYVLGRSQAIVFFEIVGMIPILAGILLAMRGWPGLRALWFPVFFVVFLNPLPGTLVDAWTGALKQQVSSIAEQLLYAVGYPVARSGVVITIGQYQLLVADACSGLNSMFSLSALGALFMYLTARTGLLHNGIMLASILPIAFVANIVRVLALMLITYHFGDEAGQGFLHGATGTVLLMVALINLMILDAVLARLLKPRKPA